jgi:ribA/ribD-fused uncharacterized protein
MIDSFRGEHYFLSNFSPECPRIKLNFEPFIVEGDDFEYPQSETAFQAAKTLFLKERQKFWLNITPKQAKNIGSPRSKAITLREDWNTVFDGRQTIRLAAMRGILHQKFNPTLIRRKLMSTHPHELIEGNDWHDDFWGICNGKCFHSPHEPYGQNWLGKILMELRYLHTDLLTPGYELPLSNGGFIYESL